MTACDGGLLPVTGTDEHGVEPRLEWCAWEAWRLGRASLSVRGALRARILIRASGGERGCARGERMRAGRKRGRNRMKQGWLASETTDAPELSRSVKCCVLSLCQESVCFRRA